MYISIGDDIDLGHNQTKFGPANFKCFTEVQYVQLHLFEIGAIGGFTLFKVFDGCCFLCQE